MAIETELSIRLPILVTGLAGVPGYALFRYFQNLYPGEVYGVRPKRNPCVSGDTVFAIDAEESEAFEVVFEKFRFGTLIDASGNCALKACECDPALSKLLNYTQGVTTARLAKKYKSTLIRISTDMVFSGFSGEGNYVETDPKDPIHNYGKHQSMAEEAIMDIVPDSVLLRVPLPMDYAPGGEAGAIDWISYRFKPRRPATLFTDEYRNPIYGDDLCKVVEYILTHPFPPGIYHCGGPRLVSLYQVGQIINALGCYEPDLLIGCIRLEGGALPPRVGNLGINCDKLNALLPPNFIRPWPYLDSLFPSSYYWHKTVDRSSWERINAIHLYLVKGELFS
ncbi:MAG: sugar nucleotide-binding protein [Fibrobacter sp.]|jgi:dTDP-4-dehydrorhamnose reductase|nr:sugar nucleotide-binding protein [Fibrobacter sp.]